MSLIVCTVVLRAVRWGGRLCLPRCKSESSLPIVANFEGSDVEGRSIAELQRIAAGLEEGELHGLDGPHGGPFGLIARSPVAICIACLQGEVRTI